MGSASVPGACGLYRLSRAVMLVQELLCGADAGCASGKLGAMLTGDDLGGGRRGVELAGVDVAAACDAVNVLVVVFGRASCGLALPLGQSRLLFHAGESLARVGHGVNTGAVRRLATSHERGGALVWSSNLG